MPFVKVDFGLNMFLCEVLKKIHCCQGLYKGLCICGPEQTSSAVLLAGLLRIAVTLQASANCVNHRHCCCLLGVNFILGPIYSVADFCLRRQCLLMVRVVA